MVQGIMTGQKVVNLEGLVAETDGKLRIIRFNNPKKKNAITPAVYEGFAQLLRDAAEDPSISVVAVTGTGDFYSSGNDFTAAMKGDEENSSLTDKAELGLKVTRDFIASFIDFPKPIVAVLNGPAVGVAVTTLALMDAVYATESAWLHTPFTNLGLCPEGCSSLTFPRIMGPAKASELLLFGKKVTAKEAETLGLITEVFPASTFQLLVWSKLKKFSELPSLSLQKGKKLCRQTDREILHQVNKAEMQTLAELSKSEQTMEAMMNWFSRRSQSKL